jgi:hypothetical protein
MAINLGPQELYGSHTRIEDGAGMIIRSSINNTGWRKTPSGGYMIYDIPIWTAFQDAHAACLDVYAVVNQNAAGSGVYRSCNHSKVFLSTGWNGSGYTPEVVSSSTLIARNNGGMDIVPRIYLDGSGSLVAGEYANLVSYSGAGNTSIYWNTAGVYLRIKFNGFNTGYPSNSADRLMVVKMARAYN